MSNKTKDSVRVVYVTKKKYDTDDEVKGGMWKIAYADFVTAMMCFFLLLWLINTTPKEKLEGLAQYFATKSSTAKNTGTEEGKEQKIAKKSQPQQLLNSTAGEQVFDSNKFNLVSAEEKQSFINTMNTVKKDKTLQEFSENIVWDITSDGLRIQITDTNNRPMFKPDTYELAPYMKRILNAVSSMIQGYPNYISITGHTASVMNPAQDHLDSWQLSALRANEVRKFLSSSLKPDQVVRITGKADKEPMVPGDPFNSQNARITITLLTNGSVSKFQQSVPEKSFYKK